MTGLRRVIVIGSGRRVRNNFLPALDCLRDQAEIVGVWSPWREHAVDAAAPWVPG